MADPSAPPPSDHEMAAALDAALDAMQNGQPVDRAALLARYPALAGVLDALGQIFAPTSTANGHVATPLAQPQRIGPYVVERELGVGGFGVVYLGYDPDVKRRVAVKLLHSTRLDANALARFQREAHATGRLRHPGIVQLYDYSRQGPPWFLVTEYVEGVEPCQWCRQRRSTPTEIAALVARVADAVEYAHRQGVCHRDLKPGNILVDDQGQPHVLDFGLARLDPSTTAATATGDGHVLGSLPYMSPEQASGQSHKADARSDVYSLGVILYELLTGQLPFQGPAHELPARVMESTPPPPRELVPDLPRDLEAVCLAALARRPQDRYASAADLAADLRAFLEGRPVVARPLGILGRIRRVLDRRHLETLRRGWPALLLSLGTVILFGYALVNHWELTLNPPWLVPTVLSTKAVQLVAMAGLTLWLWPAPQGSAGSTRWRWADRTPTERQVLTLASAYYLSYLILLLLNLLLPPLPVREGADPKDIPKYLIHPAPVLALLAGMGFLNLGATVWGWFYVWGGAFLGLALAVGFAGSYGSMVLGAAWFVCLVVGSIHLHWSR